MTWWQAIGLGLVQGLTEFLPISSSGHLALFSYLFGLPETNISFVMAVHAATLIAVGIYFWKTLLKLRIKGLVLLALATLPAVVFGLLFKDALEASFNSLILTGLSFIVSGVLNMWTDRKLNQLQQTESVSAANTQPTIENWSWDKWPQVLKVGLMQAVSIIPAISRSGSTVFAGIWVGWSRQEAFTFSFLMSIPAVGGAIVLQGVDLLQGAPAGVAPLELVIGSISAFVTGYASLWMLEYMIKKARYEFFGYYCVLVGFLVMGLAVLG